MYYLKDMASESEDLALAWIVKLVVGIELVISSLASVLGCVK